MTMPWDTPADAAAEYEIWRGDLVEKPVGSGKLNPKAFANYRLMLTHHGAVRGQIRLNRFSGVIEIGAVPWNRAGWRQCEDMDFAMAREFLQGLNLDPSKGDATDALMAAAAANGYHPVLDYLSGLQWDGVQRIDTWLADYLHTEDSEYSRAIAARSLISAIARVRRPGCQVDTMLVLEGDQGLKKSSAIIALFGEQFTRASVDLFSQHQKLALTIRGAWAVEVAEFTAVRKSDTDQVKGMISIRTDSVRLPYGRAMVDMPRQSIFIGSINPGESGYLNDSTGNRRYWPVTVRDMADVDALARIRDQLWAEANARYERGEQWWLTPAEEALAAAETAEREETHPWDDVLRSETGMLTECTANQALAWCGIPKERWTRSNQMQVAKCLKRIGFKQGPKPMGNSGLPRKWVRE